eukprot:CAMPEP_0198303116 /NCGR_PEP_ID=MMETSP1449-20131203/56723_1 /TAXON_ID=420275 /ORGANISM="Attheya septentrionalis, Strain CCMP2084" /LENGTH=903 /DNA_ID=CAMNT_0044005601 /DNA_START=351 /DNA_END=3062 /DNA_ORIENTATION=-
MAASIPVGLDDTRTQNASSSSSSLSASNSPTGPVGQGKGNSDQSSSATTPSTTTPEGGLHSSNGEGASSSHSDTGGDSSFPSVPAMMGGDDNSQQQQNRNRRNGRRKKYERKREKPPSEKAHDALRMKRQAAYETVRNRSVRNRTPSIWSFEDLFPAPVWDEETIKEDLYGVSKRDAAKKDGARSANRILLKKQEEANNNKDNNSREKMKAAEMGSTRLLPRKKPRLSSELPYEPPTVSGEDGEKLSETSSTTNNIADATIASQSAESKLKSPPTMETAKQPTMETATIASREKEKSMQEGEIDIDVFAPVAPGGRMVNNSTKSVDSQLTRMVQDRIFGYRRQSSGSFSYDTSLMGDGAVQFRDGIRLGNPLKINTDRLTYLAKQELRRGKVEEAQGLYEKAIEIDPRDGRAYLGLSKVAERRRDFAYARDCLTAGIANSITPPLEGPDGTLIQTDKFGNPFLLQALGWLEERMGHLAEAESLYISAAKSRPSHAAAWVALAQLRTRKLRQGANAGRICFQTAERELKATGQKPSSHVYTAWAALEYKNAGDVRRSRELFKAALQVDPKCSAAWLQLGVMEAAKENWDTAEECFETVLKFDQRNSRVIQAYAIMESKRPDGDSRRAIDLFERALKTNPRDAGVLQAYALYVAKLGDVDSARGLLRRGTEVNKRDPAVWQAWGVLETRDGYAEDARDIFQQGIWACAQLSGGQSGGWRCARLWQAWGVLEAREGEHAAARRCFSRALDADNRNVAAVTAWTLMEEDMGNHRDARLIFERALKQFSSSSDAKMALWRNYEVMEERAGDMKAAQSVYQRAMRESMTSLNENASERSIEDKLPPPPAMKQVLTSSQEVEVVRWQSRADTTMDGEVWMNNGAIEGRVPPSLMKKKQKKAREAKNDAES